MAVTIIGGSGIDYLQESLPSNPSTGQIWQQISTGERWRWNGTYWLDVNQRVHTLAASITGTTTIEGGSFDPAFNYFVDKFAYRGYLGNRNATNFYSLQFRVKNNLNNNNGIYSSVAKTTLQLGAAFEWGSNAEDVNIFFSPVVGVNPVTAFALIIGATGSPGFMGITLETFYRRVYKI